MEQIYLVAQSMSPLAQPLDGELILVGLSGECRRWVRELRVHAEIDSTNSHLVGRAASESIDGVACFAERQTKGRGRRGRTWLTPPGNIALSLGKSISIAIGKIAPLSLVVGLAVVAAMVRSGIKGVSLKWPNDVLLDGAKVGGVLIELSGIGSPLVVVIGVGINVGSGREVSARLGTHVGDVLTKHNGISRNQLAAGLISSIHEFTNKFESDGFAEMRKEWERLHAHQDRSVLVMGASESVEGIARGVTMDGELILETVSGIRHFSGGEVSLRGEQGRG